MSGAAAWSEVALGDVAEKMQDGPFGSNLKSSDYVDHGVRVVRLQNIGTGRFNDDSKAFIAEEHFDRLRKHRCLPGDVLIATLGDPIIRACIQPTHVGEALNKADCIQLRCDPEVAVPEYIAGFLNSDLFHSQANRMAHGQTRPRVNLSQLRSVRVPLPPIEEQRRIAAVLDQADELRSKRRAALALLDILTESLFLDMFGDAVEAALPLGEVFAEKPIFGSMIPPSPDQKRWLALRVGNIQGSRLDLRDRKYIDLPAKDVRHAVRDGDLLMARAIASQSHLGKCIVAYPGADHWAFDSHLMRLRLDSEQMRPEYLKAWLSTPRGRSAFLAITRRSNVQFNVNTKEIATLRVPAPHISLQSEFVSRLAAIERERVTLESSDSVLDGLFASLQSRAFRGEL